VRTPFDTCLSVTTNGAMAALGRFPRCSATTTPQKSKIATTGAGRVLTLRSPGRTRIEDPLRAPVFRTSQFHRYWKTSPPERRVAKIRSAETDIGALAKFANEPGFILLREKSGWRMYRRPVRVLSARDPETLQDALAAIDQQVRSGGEAAGFLSYEAGYALEPKLRPRLGGRSDLLCWFGFYDTALRLDQLGFPPGDSRQIVQNRAPQITRGQYDAALSAIHEWISAGDVYQINFTYRVAFESLRCAWCLFTSLCHRHPVPYAAFVNTGLEQIVSLSPELFFSIRGRRIVVKPMKGTADRGLTLEDDVRCGEALRVSEKNRAENVMIVDLMRNDLGRICSSGSVRTTRLFEVERFPSVWQMTSTVEGELGEECTPDSVIRALFPSGSVTGAPKIRAMELISELETAPRGIYTGSIGYFARTQAQFNVAIRTAILQGRDGLLGVGGGITYDSSSAEEWKESQSKAAFLTQDAPDFKIIETMRWEREYGLVEEHLQRMRASAEYFGFRFEERTARETLGEVTRGFLDRPQRVRLLLAPDGSLEVDSSEIMDVAPFGQVRLSTQSVLSSDRFLYHKTTRRRMYDEELAAARAAQCDDAVFFNERGELTEGTIHNVFVVQGARWRTPAIACGVLPGTYRALILRSFPNAREDVLKLDDLASADAIYLCNSVRGMFPVRLWGDPKVPQFQARRVPGCC
jgi:para-aminobenzoate synthetase / 4-amino-4-deoxychorismate lyase